MNHQYTRIRYVRSGDPAAGRQDLLGSLRARAAGPIGRALALVAGGLVLVAALFVSAIVFSLLLVAGAVAGGWFWWKTRALRREIRERLAQMQQGQAGDDAARRASWGPSGARDDAAPARAAGDVIDGDFIREPEQPSR
jgi:hypothetical protein